MVETIFPERDRKIVNKNQIVYPLFYKCLQYIQDPFWYDVFENLSIGKCPSCIYISKNAIFLSNKKKNFLYSIPGDSEDPKAVFNEIKELLINNTPLCSNIDTQNQKKERVKEAVEEDSWFKIRKKNEKELHIIKYVLREKTKYNLDWNKARSLYSLIKLAFIYKTQTSKDIVFEKNKIKSIRGIEYDEQTGMFVNKFIHKTSQTEEETTKNYLFFYWDKFLLSTVKTK